MKTNLPLILASGSPRRQQLLREAGFDFEVVVRPVAETFSSGLSPREVAVWLSEQKARAYKDLATRNVVITADTVVALENRILGKPADAQEAFDMIRALSGKAHQVISGVTLFHKDRLHSFFEETMVWFRDLSDAEIRYYISEYKPFDKAGAYGIQEWIGMIGVSRIEGDFYNVMGLPVCRLYSELGAWQ